MITPSSEITVVASICGLVAATTGAGGGGGGGAGLLPQKDIVRTVDAGVHAGRKSGDRFSALFSKLDGAR